MRPFNSETKYNLKNITNTQKDVSTILESFSIVLGGSPVHAFKWFETTKMSTNEQETLQHKIELMQLQRTTTGLITNN